MLKRLFLLAKKAPVTPGVRNREACRRRSGGELRVGLYGDHLTAIRLLANCIRKSP